MLLSLEQNLVNLTKETIEYCGFELLGVRITRHKQYLTVCFFIDHSNGITIDDCDLVSRRISAILDVEDPIKSQYTLEVSSPGLDRPLFSLEHFQQFLQNEVAIKLKTAYLGKIKLQGVISKVENQVITITTSSTEITINFSNIAKANLVPNLKF